jgi:serine/threonine protein kinase/WD40 repeat protein
MSTQSSGREPVEQLAEEFAARLRRGEHPSVTEYTQKYPELAAQIRDLFPALAVMEQFGSVAGPPTGPYHPQAGSRGAMPSQLGEYRILREIGHGGMGVVYEAVQESLGRHVALKVLPFHHLMNPTHLERFRREARAAAQLHHTNIVPVFGVGEWEGIHYYAMQFIQGQGLDAVLEEVRRLRARKSGPAGEGGQPTCELSASIAQGLLTGRFEGAEIAVGQDSNPDGERRCQDGNPDPRLEIGPGVSATCTRTEMQPEMPDGHSELASQTETQYCRSVAQVGVQVAEALAYAHKQRILHRDIKPSNLLLDTRGTVWITDFGLAKAEGSDDLTSTGDIVGTVRFMAPERFQGKADPRSDIYSLGLTLYEMLTLRPAFADSHRARLMERVTKEDPPRPRKLDPHIPRDLETIVLKAIAKAPADRYASAEALAEDLRRFLADRPIQARRTSLAERTWRWCRRNPVVAALAGVVVAAVLSVVVLSVVMASTFREAAQKDRERLFESLVSQAQAERRAGDRQRSLELLAEAAKIRPTDDVRLQAIQTIASSGVRFLQEVPSGDSRGEGDKVFSPVFSLDGKLVALIGQESFPVGPAIQQPAGAAVQGFETKPVLHVREFPSGKLLAKRSDFYTPLRFRPTTSHLAIAKDIAGPVTYLWDPVVGKDLGTYAGANPVFSANGAYLATSSGQQVHIWNLAQGREAKPPPRGTPLQFVSERELLLLDEGSYRRWDFILGREAYSTPKGLVGLAVSAKGRLAALHGRLADPSREAILVWDLIDGKQVAVLPGLGFVPSSVSFSSDDKQLALEDSSGKRLTILVWDLATRNLISRLSSRGLQSSQGSWSDWHTWGYPPPSFSPNGAFLVARGVRGGRYVLCLWDIETGAEIKALPQITYFWWREQGRVLLTLGARLDEKDFFTGTGNPDGSAYLPDEKGKTPPYLPSGHLNLWEVTHPTSTYVLDGGIQACSFNEDGSRVAVNDVVWDVKKNAEGYFLRRSAISSEGLFPMFVGRDTVWAYSVKPRGGAYAALRQLAPEKREFVLPRPVYPEIDKKLAEDLIHPREWGDFRAYRLALSPDGKRALVASRADFFPKRGGVGLYATPLELWDPVEGKRLAFWNQDNYVEGLNEPVASHIEVWNCFQFSPDGNRVATGSYKGLKIWNVSRGKVERMLADDRPVDQLAFSRDGKQVLAVQSGNQRGGTFAGTRDETRCWAAVFAVETGEELRSWEALRRERGWRSSALSPDGQWVASGGQDGLIRLWDVATGRELAHWEGHEAGVTVLTFHPDGKTLISGSKDGTLKLWNLPYIHKELTDLGLDWRSE